MVFDLITDQARPKASPLSPCLFPASITTYRAFHNSGKPPNALFGFPKHKTQGASFRWSIFRHTLAQCYLLGLLLWVYLAQLTCSELQWQHMYQLHICQISTPQFERPQRSQDTLSTSTMTHLHSTIELHRDQLHSVNLVLFDFFTNNHPKRPKTAPPTLRIY